MDTPTPITDAVAKHGSRNYNHPRYDKKLIDLCRSLERDYYDLLSELMNIAFARLDQFNDPNEFHGWAKSRARHTIGLVTKGGK